MVDDETPRAPRHPHSPPPPTGLQRLHAALEMPAGGLRPVDRGPIAAYLATLSPSSHRVQRSALVCMARLLAGDHSVPGNHPNRGPADEVALGALDAGLYTLTAAHVDALRVKLLTFCGPATVNRYLAALRGVMQAARRLGIVTEERRADVAGVKGAREDAGKPPRGRAIEPAELRALMAAADTLPTTFARARAAAMLSLLAGAGLRREEAASLRWADVDWGRVGVGGGVGEASTAPALTPALLTVKGKGGKTRRVPLPAWARGQLLAWSKVLSETRGGGTPEAPIDAPTGDAILGFTAQSVYDLVADLGRRVVVAEVAAGRPAPARPLPSPHDFRRTWITSLLDAGIPLARVAELAGHSDVKTTTRYLRETSAWRDAAGAAVESLPDPTRREG